MRFKSLLTVLLSSVILVTPTLSASASPNLVPGNQEKFSFVDQNDNLTEITSESDGTVVVYINGVLDHSAKTDLNADTIIFKDYRDEDLKKSLTSEEEFTTTILKPSELLQQSNSAEEFSLNISPMSTSGYTFKTSYKDYMLTNLTAWGYTKDGGITRTSQQSVSILRGTAIGVAVSLVIGVLTGGLSYAVVAGAIVGCYGSAIIDGIFTRNVDAKVHYEDHWVLWKGVVNSWEFDTKQGTRYLRVIDDASSMVALQPTNFAPLGYVFDFTTFLQDTIVAYTNR